MKKNNKVKLLTDSRGYRKGDIGVIVAGKDNDGYVQVFVEGRVSTSSYAPNVLYPIEDLELIPITEEIEQLEKRLAELKAMRDRFVPKKGEGYYYLGSDLCVRWDINNKHSIDNTHIHTHNCFRTKEEAEQRVKTISKKYDIINRIEELNEGWKPDWADGEQKKWVVVKCGGNYDTASTWDTMFQSDELHFKSEEIGKHLIEEFGEEFGDELGCIFG